MRKAPARRRILVIHAQPDVRGVVIVEGAALEHLGAVRRIHDDVPRNDLQADLAEILVAELDRSGR
jgi:hypothetical protein